MTDKDNLKVNLQLGIAVLFFAFIAMGYLRGRSGPWPAEAVKMCNQGYELSKAGRHEKAIPYFTAAIRLAPNYDIAFSNRGWSFFKLERFKEALKDYDKSIELSPSADNFYTRALAYYAVQNYQAAIKDIETSNLNNPSADLQSDLNYLAGISHYQLKHREKANHFLTLTIGDTKYATRERTARAYFLRGETSREQKKDSRALSDYNRSIELDPKYAPAYYSRARLHTVQNHWKQAVNDYTAAIKVDSNLYLAYLGRGWAYYKLGDAANAEWDYNRLIRLNKYASFAYSNRGLSKILQHRDVEAAADFAAAKQADKLGKLKTTPAGWKALAKEIAAAKARRVQLSRKNSR